jgi:hypothetical protein
MAEEERKEKVRKWERQEKVKYGNGEDEKREKKKVVEIR